MNAEMNRRRLQRVSDYRRRRSSLVVFLIGLFAQAAGQPALAATQIHNISLTPATITFLGTDPDSPTITVPVAAFFRTTAGSTSRGWTLSVQATSGNNMATCPSTIPISKVQVSCTSVAVDTGATGVCAAPFNLSTGLQTVSSGLEGSGNATPYTTNINFTFTDSWRYIATNTACSVTLNYQIT